MGVGRLTKEFGPNLPAILPILAVTYVDGGCYLIQPVLPNAVRLDVWLAQPQDPTLVKVKRECVCVRVSEVDVCDY